MVIWKNKLQRKNSQFTSTFEVEFSLEIPEPEDRAIIQISMRDLYENINIFYGSFCIKIF